MSPAPNVIFVPILFAKLKAVDIFWFKVIASLQVLVLKSSIWVAPTIVPVFIVLFKSLIRPEVVVSQYISIKDWNGSVS